MFGSFPDIFPYIPSLLSPMGALWYFAPVPRMDKVESPEQLKAPRSKWKLQSDITDSRDPTTLEYLRSFDDCFMSGDVQNSTEKRVRLIVNNTLTGYNVVLGLGMRPGWLDMFVRRRRCHP